MKLIRKLDELDRADSVVTVGTFDGVHRGHEELLGRLTDSARSKGWRSVVITFYPHPQIVLRPERKPELVLLTNLDEKAERLEKYGPDVLLVIEFTKEFSRKSSEEFVREILVDRVGGRKIVIGYDHAFGSDREGNLETLKRLSGEMNFEVESVSPRKVNEIVVSSTLIRKLLSEGYVAQANELLGYRYSLKGTVVKGDGRGKTIGYPTANLDIEPHKAVPKNGVYHCKADLDGRLFDAAVNIGIRPTFDQSRRTIEAHILGLGKDIYGSEIGLSFESRIRDERKFGGVEELVEQIKKDVEQIKQKT